MVVVAGKVGRFVEIISFVYVVDLVVRTFFFGFLDNVKLLNGPML